MIKNIIESLGLALSIATYAINVVGQDAHIYSVNGKIAVEQIDFALTHEHVMSNFGALAAYSAQYEKEHLMSQVVPYLQKLKSLGVQTIFDCTAAYFGRNVEFLKEISKESELHIITNTGFYGAGEDRYVPKIAYDKSVEEIAKIWISEYEEGIDGTGIKPGFIKLGFDDGKPSEIDLKLFEAGIVAHLETGLTLAVHTGNNSDAVKQQLDLLHRYGVSPSAWVWVHANKMEDSNMLLGVASKEGWISLDGVNEDNLTEYVERLLLFKSKNLLHKVLLSHDGNSFPRGGAIRAYHAIPELLIPELRNSGFTDKEIEKLTKLNPVNAFSITIRKI